MRQDKFLISLNNIVVGQRIAVFADQNWIDNDRHFDVFQSSTDRFGNRGRSHGSSFNNKRWDVGQNSVDLVNHQLGRHRFHSADTNRILNRQQRHGRHSVHAHLLKRFQVRLQTRAAAGVGTGDRQSSGVHKNRNRFGSLIISRNHFG